MNYNGLKVAVDLDGTLCEPGFDGTNNPAPIKKNIKLINEIYQKRGVIIICTARHPKYYQKTLAWLIESGVQFHGIALRYKPSCDIYIDDMAYKPEELYEKGMR